MKEISFLTSSPVEYLDLSCVTVKKRKEKKRKRKGKGKRRKRNIEKKKKKETNKRFGGGQKNDSPRKDTCHTILTI